MRMFQTIEEAIAELGVDTCLTLLARQIATDASVRFVVINRCHGGFSLSKEAKQLLRSRGYDPDSVNLGECRADAELVSVVRELGERANGRCAELRVVEIPASVEWQIEEYDGMEWIAEKHRTWS